MVGFLDVIGLDPSPWAGASPPEFGRAIRALRLRTALDSALPRGISVHPEAGPRL